MGLSWIIGGNSEKVLRKAKKNREEKSRIQLHYLELEGEEKTTTTGKS